MNATMKLARLVTLTRASSDEGYDFMGDNSTRAVRLSKFAEYARKSTLYREWLLTEPEIAALVSEARSKPLIVGPAILGAFTKETITSAVAELTCDMLHLAITTPPGKNPMVLAILRYARRDCKS